MLYFLEQLCSILTSINPFSYSRPVPPSELIDRDSEAAEILDKALGGTNLRLMAPRRFGKTSLLKRVIGDAQAHGLAAVYVDFFGVLTLADVAARIEAAYAEALEGQLKSWFRGIQRRLRPTLSIGTAEPVPTTLDLSLDPQAEPPLLERLALPRELHERTGARVLVVFDEFQDVIQAKDRADAVIRSEIQHHGDAASYVFAGSQLGMMRALFTDKRRAMYGQSWPIELPPLDPVDVADYVSAAFLKTDRSADDVMGSLLDAAQGHPQRTMLFAHALWDEVAPGEAATGEHWDSAFGVAMNVARDELRAIWTGLSTGQRRVLTAIAENSEGLYAGGRRHGGSRGGAVKSSAQALLDLGEIAEDDSTATSYRVVDPMLRLWILAGRPGA